MQNGGFIYNGIDRKNNGKGYTEDNIVSCCKQCNFAKRNMSYKEFKFWINKLVKFYLRNK